MKSYHQYIYPNVLLTDNSVSFNGKICSLQLDTGWRLGKGLVSPKRTNFWVEIPKNASNSMSEFLHYNRNWKDCNRIQRKVIDAQYHVILRDPADRWKKCITEICNIYRQERVHSRFDYWFKRQEFTNLYKYYDLHIVRQVDFLIGLNWHQTNFYYLDDNLSENILKAFDDTGPFPTLNVTRMNKSKMRILQMVEDLVTPDFELQLKEFYALDYELISKVDFISYQTPELINT